MDKDQQQLGLFAGTAPEKPKNASVASEQPKTPESAPLAYRSRPVKLDEFVGQEHIFKRFPMLSAGNFKSLILWGPAGTGKTTLAHLVAKNSGRELYNFNAVLGGVADLKKLIARGMEMKRFSGKPFIIFIDEIHRFNKSQQDALLPHVESGEFTLIGATTEHPKTHINRALISRLTLIEFKKLTHQDIETILESAYQKSGSDTQLPPDCFKLMARKVSGDARSALNMLELLLEQYDPAKSLEDNLKELFVHESVRHYDKSSDRHYDVISAFIKSMRGSDPDAAILWLAVMIDGGEDPLFIARRLIIFASEDIGNADPSALSVAVNAFTAISHIGMPEGRITLGHAVTYLACAPKSNAAYLAINEALAYVKNQETIEVPGHLTHFSQTEVKYRYPHNYPRHFVPQQYMPEGTPQFYRPTEQAREKLIKNTQENLWQR